MHWIFLKYLVILLVGCGFGGFRFLGRYTYLHAPVAQPVDGDVSVKHNVFCANGWSHTFDHKSILCSFCVVYAVFRERRTET